MKDKNNRIVSHIVSLVLGIISVITVLFWYLSLPTGITAIILGAKSYKKEGKAINSVHIKVFDISIYKNDVHNQINKINDA